MSEEQVRNKLFGKPREEQELNTCPGCGNEFKRFVGSNCTMTCYYKEHLK